MAGLHNRKVMVCFMVCALMLAGCGAAKVPETVEVTSLVIDKEGAVTSHIVGVFDRQFHSVDKLKKMAQEEVAAYNTANQTGNVSPVTLERVESLAGNDGSVIVTYLFDGAQTYEKYNGNSFFYGTVEEAEKDGYHFDKMNQVLYDTKGDKSIVSSNISSMTKKHVIILSEQTRVYAPYKVAYISESAKTMEDGSIDTTGVSEEEYPVIIVLDK